MLAFMVGATTVPLMIRKLETESMDSLVSAIYLAWLHALMGKFC